MKKLLCYFVISIFPIALSAQINESDTLGTKASLTLNGFYQEGNVETLIFRVKSEVSVKLWKKSVFKTNNSYVYQEFGRKKADEDVLSLNFLYFNPEKRIHPVVLGFFSTNFRRKIDLRYLIGAGVTFQIIDNQKNWLKLSVSSEFEETDFSRARFNRSEYNGNGSISTIRGTIWVGGRYNLFEDKIIATHESYYQPSLEESNNFRWRADIGLELPIWEFLNFNVNYLQIFESIVIANQKRQDRFLTLGFTLKSY